MKFLANYSSVTISDVIDSSLVQTIKKKKKRLRVGINLNFKNQFN